MSGPTGIAPIVDAPARELRLCGSCATLIRYDPEWSAWSHVALGFDHAPELVGSWAPRLASSVAPPTELELRAMDGDR
jgi:hypothetical protein